jgi:ectoine hydroxylase-related dioxygenase (phytanoyl-CoA dioxygenase family)
MQLQRALDDLDQQGYAVVEDAAPEALVDRLRDAIVRVTDEHRARGVEPFDFGPNTSMVYRLLARDDAFLDAVLAPALVAIMEHLLGSGYVANATTGSMLHEGARPGPLHADNQFFPEPFPPQAQIATAIWCLDDFSGPLGSTHLVPGSHRHLRQPRGTEGHDGAVAVEARRGSIVVWRGETWHRSGGRTEPGTRVALHTAFSRPHIRRFEAYTPEEIDRIVSYDARLTRIVGADLPYDITGDSPDVDKLLALAATARSALSDR